MQSVGIRVDTLLSDINQMIKDDLEHTVLHDLPVASVYVLAALHKKDGQRATDLAAAINVPSTSFTPTLDRLERAGLVRREPHKTDRRSVGIWLTSEGKSLKRAVEEAISRAESKYAGWLSKEAQE